MREKAPLWSENLTVRDLGAGYVAEVYTSPDVMNATLSQYSAVVKLASPGLRSYLLTDMGILKAFLGINPERRMGIWSDIVEPDQIKEFSELCKHVAPGMLIVDTFDSRDDFGWNGVSVFNRTAVTRAVQRSACMFPADAVTDPIAWLENPQNQPLWDEFNYVSTATTSRYGLFTGIPQTAVRIYPNYDMKCHLVEEKLRWENIDFWRSIHVRDYYMGHKQKLIADERAFAFEFIDDIDSYPSSKLISRFDIEALHAVNEGGYIGFNREKDSQFKLLKRLLFQASGAAALVNQLRVQYSQL